MDTNYFTGNVVIKVGLVGLLVFLFGLFSTVWVTRLFNKMIKLKAINEEGWGGVLAALKRRRDIIPNIVKAAEVYMPGDSETLLNITRACGEEQAAKSVEETAKAAADTTEALYAFKAAIENYPDIKADKHVMEIQEELSGLEERIELTRRYYNATVRDDNMEMDQFPANLIVRLMGFKRAAFFEASETPEQHHKKTERSA